MVNVTLSIPNELKQKMDTFAEINWSAVAREAFIFETDLHLFSPEFIFEEFDKYKEKILGKTERSDDEFNHLLNILKKKIKTIPNEETAKYISDAEKISPDKKDVDYLALALKLKCALWSQDRALKEKQNKVQVYSTEDLARMF